MITRRKLLATGAALVPTAALALRGPTCERVLNAPGLATPPFSIASAPSCSPANGTDPCEPVSPSGPYNILLFDDSCHLFYTTNSGTAWTGHNLPSANDLDYWSDIQMGINDGDFNDLIVYDSNYLLGVQGAVVITTIAALPSSSTAPFTNYGAGSFGSGANTEGGERGAYSSTGPTIIVCINEWSGGGAKSPRLSTNGGSSWANISGLTSTNGWIGAAFSAAAATMYVQEWQGQLHKSTNSGSSFSLLGSSPTLDFNTGAPQGSNTFRIHCSSNGSLVGLVTRDGVYHQSTNGGTTWTSVDLTTIPTDVQGSSVFACDFAMKPDGTGFLACMSGVSSDTGFNRGWTFKSSNGTTWTETNPPAQSNPAGNVSAVCCGISTDGECYAVAYAGRATVDVSTDAGITWTTTTFTAGAANERWVSMIVNT